jgi:hypothetical protein
MTSELVRRCVDYQRRTGLKDVAFSVFEEEGQLVVISICEDNDGCSYQTSTIIDTTQSVSPADEDIYLAVMLCTETLLARQSTIH